MQLTWQAIVIVSNWLCKQLGWWRVIVHKPLHSACPKIHFWILWPDRKDCSTACNVSTSSQQISPSNSLPSNVWHCHSPHCWASLSIPYPPVIVQSSIICLGLLLAYLAYIFLWWPFLDVSLLSACAANARSISFASLLLCVVALSSPILYITSFVLCSPSLHLSYVPSTKKINNLSLVCTWANGGTAWKI